MKISVTAVLLLLTLNVCAQADTAITPKLTLKWAPAGLFAGNFVLQGEYSFGSKQSLTVKLGFPKNNNHSLQYDGNDAKFDMKAVSFLAGYRSYLSKSKSMKGLYWEPYFQYVHHTSEGVSAATLDFRQVNMAFSNVYNAAGVGVQLGAQFLIRKRVVVDLFFFGPQINSASNNMKAVEHGNILPWTYEEKKEAEREVREFIDKFPIIRDKTTIMVDMNSKTVTGDFKGPLPGIRAGISFGVAF
jgi:hypothetical protein